MYLRIAYTHVVQVKPEAYSLYLRMAAANVDEHTYDSRDSAHEWIRPTCTQVTCINLYPTVLGLQDGASKSNAPVEKTG